MSFVYVLATVVVLVFLLVLYVNMKSPTFEVEVLRLGSTYTTPEELGIKGYMFVKGRAKVLSIYQNHQNENYLSVLMKIGKQQTFDVFVRTGINPSIDEYVHLVKTRKDSLEYNVVIARVMDRWALFEIGL